MEKTITRRQIAQNSPELPSHIHPLLRRIYAARQITATDQLSQNLTNLGTSNSLLNIDKAAKLLADHITAQQKIVIVGDYDADGATSSALCVLALKAMGAKNIEFLVPNRFTYGYGLTPPIVDIAAKLKPDLIMTVDNGIASHTGVDHANSLGIKVLVTDHHLAADTMPNAAVIINPNQPNDLFPSKNLAGVGVAFYVLCALRAELKQRNWFQLQNLVTPNMANYLDIVALGTVADVVSLDQNNRILVAQGLRRIRAGCCRPGITALLQLAKRVPERIVAADLGFAVGPRLNAAGRLDDMSLGIQCLLADDANQAKKIASELNKLNLERRDIEADMQFDALRKVDQWLARGGDLPYAVCLFEPDWHQGVIGLVASRIKEKINRPVIAFAKGGDGVIKGSARSIKGLHIRDVLDAVATKHPGLIDKFGGHAMAAGLTIAATSFDEFNQALNQEVKTTADKNIFKGSIETDGELQAEEFSLAVAKLLREAGPWGQNFPEPEFDGEFEIVNQRLVAEKHLKLTLRHPQSQKIVDAIAFNIDLDKWPNYRQETVRIVYRLDVNEYQGVERLQLMVSYLV